MPREDEVIVSAMRNKFEAEVRGPVIFCPVGPLLTIAASMFRAKKQRRPLIPGRVYHISRKRGEVTLFGPGQGAPMAVMALERCRAQGTKYFILVGVCGSLNEKARIGDLVIATSAISEEGTSGHYEPDKNPPHASEKVSESLRNSMKESNEDFHEGKVWTTDALYRETLEKVKAYGEQGVLAVEMELAALFTAGKFHGVEVGGLMVVSDELFELEWNPGFTSPHFLNQLRKSAKIALDAALSFCEP